MIMSENEKVKIIWVDGMPCIEVPPNTIMEKRQKSSVEHPFGFGQLQELKQGDFMPNLLKELDKVFTSNINIPIFPANWKIFSIDQWDSIKELKKEDKEDDN